MSDAPKVIWAWNIDTYGDHQAGRWVCAGSFVQLDNDVEYVRADLVQELKNRITELEETISGRYEQMEEEYED